MSADGSFSFAGREWDYEILNVEGYDGEELDPGDFENADRVFYSVTDSNGETFYRWVGGPYLEEGDVVEAIEDEVEHYQEIAS